MKPEEMLSYNPEMDRCRQTRAKLSRKYKSVAEALEHLGELSAAKRKQAPAQHVKASLSKVGVKRKLSA